MVDGSTVQSTVSSILTRDDLKKTILIDHYTLVENAYGDDVQTFSSQETIEGIPLRYKKTAKKYDTAGLYKGSSMTLLLPADTIVGNEDVITLFNQEYDIVGIDNTSIGEYIIHQIVFLLEKVKPTS